MDINETIVNLSFLFGNQEGKMSCKFISPLSLSILFLSYNNDAKLKKLMCSHLNLVY